MALPAATVRSLTKLQDLLAEEEPRPFLLMAIGAVHEAPLCLAAIEEKMRAGWSCMNLPQVRRAACFANQLFKLQHDVFPKLTRNRHDRATLRSLRSCGKAILKVRRASSGTGNLFDMAGRFSNCLERIAREALSTSKRERYTVRLEWIHGKARDVEETRASPVNFVTAPPPLPIPAAMALPAATVRSLTKLQDLLAEEEPRPFLLMAIGAVHEAPLCLAAIEEKMRAGWSCMNLPQVRRAACFANQLFKLQHDVFPKLFQDSHDRATLRSLRSCGQAILRVRQSSLGSGNLFDMAGRFSNCLARIAREALSTSKREPYTVRLEWIHGKARDVEETRASPVNFITAPLSPVPQP